MGLFDDASARRQTNGSDQEMAFLGILMAADYSDGNVSERKSERSGTPSAG